MSTFNIPSYQDCSDFFRINIANPTATLASKAYKGIETGAETLYQGIKTAEGHWEKFNANVRDWTNAKLPYPLAKISQAFIYALPALALYILSPQALALGSLLYSGCKLIQSLRNDNTYPSTVTTIPLALGFVSSYAAATEIVIGATTLSPLYVASGLIHALYAAILFGTVSLSTSGNATVQQH